MAIIRWDPFSGFPRFLTRRGFWEDEDWPELTQSQGIDVYETDNEVIVKAAVPGIPADKVDVTFEDGVLRIKAHLEETDEEKKKKKVVYRQQRVASFDYTTTLPRAVEGSKISAEVEEGIVTVKAPIAATAKPKKISVKARSK